MANAELCKQSLDLELTELIDYECSLDKAFKIDEYISSNPFDSYLKASEFNDYLINNPINIGTLLVMITQAASLRVNDESNRGYDMVMKKLANDPKQKALKEIEEHYQAAKDKFKRGGYGAEFIRTMHAKYPVIVDSDTIKKLVTRLNKANKATPVS